MSEPGGKSGIFGTITSAVERIPPMVVGMIGLNAVFVVSMTYLFIRQNDSREKVLGPLIEACAHSVPLEAIQLLQKPSQ